MAPPTSTDRPAAGGHAVRRLGRFQLLKLLSKTQLSMLWLVHEPDTDAEWVLVMPRAQPDGDEALGQWIQNARRAARVDHPGLARPVEIDEQEHWPYVAYARDNRPLLLERVGSEGLTPSEWVPSAVQLLEGLAAAHDAGFAHRDFHAGMVLFDPLGQSQCLGLGVIQAATGAGAQAQRQAAERDVLAFGLVMHHALVGHPALDDPDVMRVADRLPPKGRETIRMPWADRQAVPEALRAIVNRATERQERQRYRSARTFLRALTGWLQVTGADSQGPLSLLSDRVRSAGLLPGMPGGSRRAARLAGMDRQRIFELTDVVLEDVGLCFDLLRQVNSAAVRGAMGGGAGPILTVRRAITLLGLDGVRRAATVMKHWPGALAENHVDEFTRQMAMARQAGRIAQRLRPAGYDAELCYLLALLQRLGRLLVQYHFPEEATQIRRLTLPASSDRPGEPEEPGMSEEAAGYAVLGVDIESLGSAVARQWGFDDGARHMMRRLPMDTAPRQPHSDADWLRLTASAANELVDTQRLPARQRTAGIQRVAQRYGRALDVSQADLLSALTGEPPTEPATLGPRPVAMVEEALTTPPARDGHRADAAQAATAGGLASGASTAATPSGGLAARLAEARRAAQQSSQS